MFESEVEGKAGCSSEHNTRAKLSAIAGLIPVIPHRLESNLVP